MKDKILLILKGFVLGIANIIPGVSGGTLAITLGIYERMIEAISHFFSNFKDNLKFVMFLGIGILISLALFSNVIGFCTTDNTGAWGIENYYNSSLNGVTGRRYGYFDSDLNLIKTVKPAKDGDTVVSSIDVNIQGILEQHMKKFQKDVGSINMGCIIMNPNNGEIYAMASYPQYDLNDPRNLKEFYSEKEIKKMTEEDKTNALSKIWRNYCISDAYEPGSTFKPFTVCAALDEGVTNDNRTSR